MPEHQRPTRVSDSLQRVLQRFDPEDKMRAYRLWTFWDEEVGESIAAHAQPVSVRAGVLAVRVDSATWMQELQFLKDDIRERVNRRLGAELIRDVYFVSGAPAGDARSGDRTDGPRDAKDRRTAPIALPRIRDGEISAVFERIARAHTRRG